MSLLGRITAVSLASLSQTQERAGVLVEVTSAHPTPEQIVDALLAKLGLSEADRAALKQASGGTDLREQLIAELCRSGINTAALAYVGGGRYRGYVGLPREMRQRLLEWSRTDGRAPTEASTGTSAKQQELQAQGALARHRAELALRTQEARQQIVAEVLGTGGAQMAGTVMARHLPEAAPLVPEALPPLVLGTGMIASVGVTLDKGLELAVERQMEAVHDTPPLMSEKQDERLPVDTARKEPGTPAVPTDDELPKGELMPADEQPTSTPEEKGEPTGTQPIEPEGEPPGNGPFGKLVGPAITAATTTAGIAADKAVKEVEHSSSVSEVSKAGQAIAPVAKFRDYIFNPEKKHGKEKAFELLGYGIEHSEELAQIYQAQATEKFARGEYTLGVKDHHGQRISIEIELTGIGSATGKVSYLRSGWMMRPDGTITLNTPFTGYTREGGAR